MLTKLTFGAVIVATAAFLTPASATPPISQTPVPALAQGQEGLVEQVHWRHRHRHCRRVCHGHMHWNPWRGSHCHGHWHYRCHYH